MLLQSSKASVRIFGGQGPTWVALHGLMDSSEAWSDPRLPRPLLAPDLPGWGGTPLLPGHSEIWVDWLEETLREHNAQDFYLLGHSLGGGLALAAAQRLRPRGILLLAPLGVGTTRLPGALMRARPLLRHGAHRAMHLPLLTDTVYSTLFSGGQRIDPALRQRLRLRSNQVVHGALEALPLVDELSGRSFRFDGPTEILWGRRDRILRLQRDRVAQLPQARLRFLEDCGHDIIREYPSAVSDAAERLLRDT